MALPRAATAQGRARAADQGAQVHQGLVEVSRPPAVQQQLDHGPEQGGGLPGWGWKSQKARQQTSHVAVQNGVGAVTDRGGNGGRRGATETGKPFKAGAVGGKLALGCRQLRGNPMKSLCPGIVTQPLPGMEHVLPGCSRQGRQIRKPIQPTPPEGERHRQSGLLQHHLRHPNGIGGEHVVRTRLASTRQQSPRHVTASVVCPPTQQAGVQIGGTMTQPGFLPLFKRRGPLFGHHRQSQASQCCPTPWALTGDSRTMPDLVGVPVPGKAMRRCPEGRQG